uniref:LsmAD domain-containing protein n=1 Tax=Panagrolaimus sp. ES5 TaxID=591445 RepID=A0AC34F4C9_9BILA
MAHDEAEDNVKNQWKKHPLNPTKSTLSLHIAAYENLNEDNNVRSIDENEGLKINLGEFDLAKKWKTVKQLFTGLPLDIKISFEIPRQQNEGQSNDPQIMQFKASQKLLNPNQSTSSNKSHRKNKRGSKRSYFQSQQTSDINSANWRAPSSSSSTDMAHLKLNNKSSAFHGSAEDQQKEGDLQTFEHWGENGVPAVADDTQVSRGGWSVEEMFRKNQSLGVQTTYKDDLTQYTTCPAEGSKEDRARAAEIAKEIEACEKSKAMSFLENDDEERDLDKETVIPDDNVKTDITNDTTTSPSKNSCEVSQ